MYNIALFYLMLLTKMLLLVWNIISFHVHVNMNMNSCPPAGVHERTSSSVLCCHLEAAAATARRKHTDTYTHIDTLLHVHKP